MRNKWSDPNFAPITLVVLFTMGILGAGVSIVIVDAIFNLGLS